MSRGERDGWFGLKLRNKDVKLTFVMATKSIFKRNLSMNQFPLEGSKRS